MANTDYERLTAVLPSLAAKFSNQAVQHENAAAAARAKKKHELGQQHGITDNNRARLEWTHDQEINKHSKAAVAARVRAEFATDARVLFHGPYERNDIDYMREHGEHVALAQRCGCLHQSDKAGDE